MNNKTHTSSNKYMAVPLSCIVLGTISCVLGVMITAVGMIGTIDSNSALLMDYENGTAPFNCSGFVIGYGVLLVVVGIGVIVVHKLNKIWSIYSVTVTAASLCGVTIVSLCTLGWIVQYGHVASLDVQARTHDTDLACWDGVVLNDYNKIQLLPVADNCFREHGQIFCVPCRKEYYREEPTFVRTYRFTIVFVLLAMLALNAWSLTCSYKLLDSKISVSTSIDTAATTTESSLSSTSGWCDESYYMVPRNNKPVQEYYRDDPMLLPPPPTSWLFIDEEEQ
jgi:hypothetical protein